MTCNAQGSRKHVRRVRKVNGEVLIQGWLNKRGPTAQYCFKRHWCVLRPRCLSYYADQMKQEKKGDIELSPSTRALSFDNPQAPGDARGHSPEHPFGFVLDLDPGAGARRRLFYFEATNDEAVNDWTQAFLTAVNAAQGSRSIEAGGRMERRGSAFDDDEESQGEEPAASTPTLRRRDADDSVATPIHKAIERKGSWLDDVDALSSAASSVSKPVVKGVREPASSDSKVMAVAVDRRPHRKLTSDLPVAARRTRLEESDSEEVDGISAPVKNAWGDSVCSGQAELPTELSVDDALSSTTCGSRQTAAAAQEVEAELKCRADAACVSFAPDPSERSQFDVAPHAADASDRAVGDRSRGVLVRAVMPVGSHVIYISKGSIIDFKGDVIVNAANEAGQAGGGLDCSLIKAAGPDVDAERLAFPEVRPGIRIPVGKARATNAGKLSARYIVHAVGPNYKGARRMEAPPTFSAMTKTYSTSGRGSIEALDAKLHDAYVASLEAAFERGCQKIGFALLSSGAFCADRGLENVLEIALDTVRSVLEGQASTSQRVEVDLVAYEAKELHALFVAARNLGFEGVPDTSVTDQQMSSAASLSQMGTRLSISPHPAGRMSMARPAARLSVSPRPGARASVSPLQASRASISPRVSPRRSFLTHQNMSAGRS